MSNAKYYLYRNLHKPGCFSVKYRGRVLEVIPFLVASNVEFRVSKAGQKRVRREKRKNVHAYVVAESYSKYPYAYYPDFYPDEATNEITYNPYTMQEFQWKKSGVEVDSVVKYVILEDGKVYGKH